MKLWLCGVVRSGDKLTPLYVHYRSVYGKQMRHNGDLPLGARTNKQNPPVKKMKEVQSANV